MKMLLKKCVAVVILTYSVIVLCNYYVDTANIFHTDILVDIAEKLHGGKMIIDSEKGVGTTITFTLKNKIIESI